MPRFRRLPGLLLGLIAALTACDWITDPEAEQYHPRPVDVGGPMRFTDVAAGWFHTCAAGTDGLVYCWGKNEFGESGPVSDERCEEVLLGTVPCRREPRSVAGAPALHELDASMVHTCGLSADGRAWCWGQGAAGQLGNGPESARRTAAPVEGEVAFRSLDLDVTGGGTCAIGEDGGLYCWGVQANILSMGGATYAAVARMPTTLAFDDVALGQLSACGVSAGTLWCWGNNWYGQLGTGSVGQFGGLESSVEPIAVVEGEGFDGTAVAISHACGLRTDGAALCWGYLTLIEGTEDERYGPRPSPAGGPAFVRLFAGATHTCGLTASGEAWCWGMNATGQLGDGTTTDRPEPVQVRAPAGVAFTRLALGGVHTCGLARDGRLFCWGHNVFGQLGR